MNYLINRPSATWVAGFTLGLLAAFWPLVTHRVYNLLVDTSGSLLGTTVSLMGFVIAALAIVLSTPSRSVRLIRERSDKLWRQLTSLFTQAAGTFGTASLFLFVAAAVAPEANSTLAESMWVFFFVGLIIMSIMKVAKVIALLDLIIHQA